MKTFQLKPLEAFLGKWRGESMTFEVEGDILKIDVLLEITEILDGWGVQSFLSTDIPGFGPFKEVDIWGHDPGSDTIHMFTVTNAGQTHDHAGAFRDDETLVLAYTGYIDESVIQEDVTLAARGDELVFHNTERINGKVEVVFEGIMKKVESRPASQEA
jgi:hypothetical protein